MEVAAHLTESGVVAGPEVETRLLAAPLADGEGVGLARVWSWRGCGPGEGVGLARVWTWRGCGPGEGVGLARAVQRC